MNLAASDINGIAFNVPGIGWALLDTASNLALLPLFLYSLVGTSFMYAFLMWIVIGPAGVVLGGMVLAATKDKMARWALGNRTSETGYEGRALNVPSVDVTSLR